VQRCVSIYILKIAHIYVHAGEIRGLEFMGNVPVEVRPIIGAALCGVVASKYPGVLFFGYDTVNSLLAETFPYMGDTSMFSTHCNALQHTATHCSALRRTAMHCNALQRTATHCNIFDLTEIHSNSHVRPSVDVSIYGPHKYVYYGVASVSRLLKITGLFCKRAL